MLIAWAARARSSIPRRVRWRLGLPPAQPSGWEIGPPDFVGVGAQRSGTDWWYRLICDHPAVQPAVGKELHFFDRFAAGRLTDDEVRAYHRLFPRPTDAITGEWTPRYMHDFWTLGLLGRAAPDARILVLLRDPWERYRSGFAHEIRVLRRQLRGDREQYVRAIIAGDALSRSLYARQLTELFDHFHRSQVLLLQYERCVDDPARELRRSYEFLGLDRPDHIPNSISARTGRSVAKDDPPEHLERAAKASIARDSTELIRVAPELDLDLWRSCRAPDGD